jgi:hypothetical protein
LPACWQAADPTTTAHAAPSSPGADCAFLADWRQYDGYFYLFYAGSDDGDSFQLRGHGKIGVARSRDLVEWRAPPK